MWHEGLPLVAEEFDKQWWQVQKARDMHLDLGTIC